MTKIPIIYSISFALSLYDIYIITYIYIDLLDLIVPFPQLTGRQPLFIHDIGAALQTPGLFDPGKADTSQAGIR